MLESTPNLADLIRWELHCLQISPTLLGHHYLLYAVEQVVKDPLRVKDVTKDLYPDTAHNFDTTWKAVERNIRYLSVEAWKNAPERLSQMAGVTLCGAPSPARFLSILAGSLKDGRAA